MMTLKTTPEERAAARAQSSGIPGFGSTVAAHMADDIDTLLAELEEHRARMARIRELLNDLDGQDTDHVAPCPAAHSEAYRCRCDLETRKELFGIVRGLP